METLRYCLTWVSWKWPLNKCRCCTGIPRLHFAKYHSILLYNTCANTFYRYLSKLSDEYFHFHLFSADTSWLLNTSAQCIENAKIYRYNCLSLNLVQSFVTDRTQYVAVGTERSPPANCTSGVPQGSVLGPLLFAMYISPMSNVVAAHSLCYRQYADDTHLYMSVRPRSATDSFRTLSLCVDHVCRWFLQNRLLLNPQRLKLFFTAHVFSAIRFQHRPLVPFCDTV